MSDREKYALQIDAAAVLAEVNAILATCGLDPSPDDTTIARLALLRGWVLETLAKDTANRKRLAAVETERDEARRVLQISREACEEALHVLTPVRPVMDGLDRTRLALCEAIAAIRKAVGLDKEQP